MKTKGPLQAHPVFGPPHLTHRTNMVECHGGGWPYIETSKIVTGTKVKNNTVAVTKGSKYQI